MTNQIDSIRNVPCKCCCKATRHTIIASHKKNSSDGDDASYSDFYQIIECCGCGSISFREISVSSYDYEDNYDPEVDDEGTLYPPRNTSNNNTSISENIRLIPGGVFKTYITVTDAIDADFRLLCGIGLRLLVEMICAEQKCTSRNLETKIDELTQKRWITPDGADILHKIRFMGNGSAHSAIEPTKAQITLALKVIESLIENVYIFPEQAKHAFPQTPTPTNVQTTPSPLQP